MRTPRKGLIAALAAVLALLTACGGSGGDGQGVLRVGTLSDSPPNIYQENGNYTGFDNELLRAIAAKQGLQLEFVSTDFSALLGRVSSGQFDIGSSAIAQTPARKETVDFSDPYNFQSLSIEVKEPSPITDENSLAGKRIGVVQGTASDGWLTATAPAAQAVRFPNDAAALTALKSGSVDGSVFDQATAEQYVASNPDVKLKVAKSFTTDTPHGFAVKKGNTELANKINEGLKQVIADGTWERLHQQFMPTAPVPDQFRANG
ncbi:ABC transporter substrate-binding protein [Amycolatopsis nigrescens]|uniref:ABC transporter substrate-binding protein n=1 Tax=Amycolatopsis nigrescens TaxID=381445 RepID=UPI00037464CD|nr:ABC transporter substrate-binding protein [Amycolatopsis nigrescens]